MDRSRGHRGARGGSGLGIYRFRHQQSGSAIVGEDHGRRCPVAPLPWQRRLQRAGSVDRSSRALFRGDCRCDPEFLSTAQTEGDAEQAGEGESDSRATSRSAAFAPSGGCASSGGRSGAAANSASSNLLSAYTAGGGADVAGAILVAA